jgi:hypothetical protein
MPGYAPVRNAVLQCCASYKRNAAAAEIIQVMLLDH